MYNSPETKARGGNGNGYRSTGRERQQAPNPRRYREVGRRASAYAGVGDGNSRLGVTTDVEAERNGRCVLTEELVSARWDEFAALRKVLEDMYGPVKDMDATKPAKPKQTLSRQERGVLGQEIDDCISRAFDIKPVDDEGYPSLELIGQRRYVRGSIGILNALLDQTRGREFVSSDEPTVDARMLAANDR